MRIVHGGLGLGTKFVGLERKSLSIRMEDACLGSIRRVEHSAPVATVFHRREALQVLGK